MARLLKDILLLSTTKKAIRSPSEVALALDGYLKELLIKHYPSLFIIENGSFSAPFIESDQQKKAEQRLILEALGVPPNQVPIHFSAAQFNSEVLDKLFKKDNNPMWIVLKTTIPVSEHFTPKEKIQAYIDVAALSISKHIHFTARELRKVVRSIAGAAFAVAREYPSADNIIQAKIAFSLPDATTKDADSLCQEGQFGKWIVEHRRKKKVKEITEVLSANDLVPEVQKLSAEQRNPFRPSVRDEQLIIAKMAVEHQLKAITDKQAHAAASKDEQLKSVADSEKQNAYLIKEMISANEEIFIPDMALLLKLLEVFNSIEWLTVEEREQYANFAKDLENLIEAYNELNLTENITADMSLDALTTTIAKKFTSAAFVNYAKMIEKFLYSAPKIDAIELKYQEKMLPLVITKIEELKAMGFDMKQDHRSLQYFTLKPMQTMLKYPLFFRDMVKNLVKQLGYDPRISEQLGTATRNHALEEVFNSVIAAEAKVKDVADLFNEQKRKLEQSLLPPSVSPQPQQTALASSPEVTEAGPIIEHQATSNVAPNREFSSIMYPAVGAVLGAALCVGLVLLGAFPPVGIGFFALVCGITLVGALCGRGAHELQYGDEAASDEIDASVSSDKKMSLLLGDRKSKDAVAVVKDHLVEDPAGTPHQQGAFFEEHQDQTTVHRGDAGEEEIKGTSNASEVKQRL